MIFMNKSMKTIPKLPVAAIILYLMAFFIPVIILPWNILNIYRAPKVCILVLGTAGILVYCMGQYMSGKLRPIPMTRTLAMAGILILWNLINPLYTENQYYTRVALSMNICCLLCFLCTVLFICEDKSRKGLLYTITWAGIGVSIIAWCQFLNLPFTTKYGFVPTTITGTIGNSNYLGAYMLFPLFTIMGLYPGSTSKYRTGLIVMLFIILLPLVVSRCRASWVSAFFSFIIFFWYLKNSTFGVQTEG